MKHTTNLLYLRRNGQILLAMKKRGLGEGKWNGVGGKSLPNENIKKAVVRECLEEIAVKPSRLQIAGHIRFFDPHKPDFEHDCYIFTTRHWEGEPAETEEMRPQWFTTTNIPYAKMWPGDGLWFPHLLAGELFEGTITEDAHTMTAHDIKIVPSL